LYFPISFCHTSHVEKGSLASFTAFSFYPKAEGIGLGVSAVDPCRSPFDDNSLGRIQSKLAADLSNIRINCDSGKTEPEEVF
jgi:hypothetical protein